MAANPTLALLRRELKASFPPDQVAALLNAFPVSQTAVLTADTATITANATLGVALTDLTLTLEPGVIYAVRAVFRIATTATPGIKFDFNGGDVGIASSYFNGEAVFDGAPAFTQTNVGVNALDSAIDAGATVPLHVVFNGVIRPSSGSRFTPRFAQSVSNGATTGVQAGSFLETTIIGPASFRIK